MLIGYPLAAIGSPGEAMMSASPTSSAIVIQSSCPAEAGHPVITERVCAYGTVCLSRTVTETD